MTRPLGTRFPDMSEVYSKKLRAIALEEAKAIGLELASGVYACMSGPSYETPAEIKMLRTLGADVVGMSTVPEAIVARHAGIEVLAVALVSNAAAGYLGHAHHPRGSARGRQESRPGSRATDRAGRRPDFTSRMMPFSTLRATG